MKKLRTIKPIPGIPVGTELQPSLISDGTYRYGFHCVAYFKEKELEGFVEEIKEPVKGWMYGPLGVYEVEEGYGLVKHMAFRTKDSAEKFANVLKDTHPHTFHGSCREFYELCEALNDRVK
jgi:hypothetical protein